MNQMENRIYQRMVRIVRRTCIVGRNGGWPGKPLNAPAVTLYPNVLAEVYAIPNHNIGLFAEFANVSPEIMAAVVEDNEKLSFPELLRLARGIGVPLDYLAAPRLSIIDPLTNKGKARRRALADLLKEADGHASWQWVYESVLSDLDRGEIITYASYRLSVYDLQEDIERQRRKQRNLRTKRRAS